MSVDTGVVLLVEDDKTLYIMATSVSTKRWTLTLPKFDEPFGVRFHFERFLGTTSVDARVVLLVEDDKTMYTMATSVSTKRWTLTSPKFDEPFGVRFHFERFLGAVSVNVRVILLVEYDETMYIPYRVGNS